MVVARRQPDRPGAGIVFLAPVKGRKPTAAAAVAGLSTATGVAAWMTGAIADAGINMRGLSAAAFGSRFVAYMAFDGAEDADKAAKAIKATMAAKASGKKSIKR
jgi:hypothetical protein